MPTITSVPCERRSLNDIEMHIKLNPPNDKPGAFYSPLNVCWMPFHHIIQALSMPNRYMEQCDSKDEMCHFTQLGKWIIPNQSTKHHMIEENTVNIIR